MSDQSTNLQMPYLAPAQAQKHLTVNGALQRLDALVQLNVASATLAVEPAAPADGAVYILPPGKTGAAWDGMANGALAYRRDGVWEQIIPRPGWRAFATDAQSLLVFTGGAWLKVWGADERRMVFTPGGDGQVSVFRIDPTRVQSPRTATIAAIAGDQITLSSADAGLFFGGLMAGCAYVRVWNISASPAQPAWVKAAPAADALQVVDAAAVAGWSAGATVQVGDPLDVTPVRSIALDVSPMLQARIGRVFRQSGVTARLVAGGAAQATVALSGSGQAGSFLGLASGADGAARAGIAIVACDAPSPISNSNLLFVQETVAGSAMGVAAVSIVGVWS